MKFDNQLDQKIPNWIFKNLRKAETILLIIIVIALIIKISGLSGSAPLLTLSFSTLATFYFFRATKKFEEASKTERLFNKALPYGWSMCTISIMFIIQGWPSAKQMMSIGMIIVCVILVLVTFLKQKEPDSLKSIDKEVMVRSFVIVAFSMLFLFSPKETLIKYHITSKQIEMTDNKNAP